VGTRLEGWQAALRLWLDYPWWGVGPYGFWYRFPAYMPLGSELDPELRHPHNLWLEVATGGGLAALLWLGLAATWLVRWARQHTADLTWPQLGLLAGLAAGVAHGQVDAFQALPDLAAWNWAALALVLAGHAAQQKAVLPKEDGSGCR
jgi:O-antigen ligase